MRVTIIGSGNVATILGRRIIRAGHTIEEVYSRDLQNARDLAAALSSRAVSHLPDLDRRADIYLIGVADKALPVIAAELRLVDNLVVHTAGSVSIDILKDASSSYGVIYPLQSLRKELSTEPVIPIFVDGNNERTRKLLFEFAQTFGDSVGFADDSLRSKLHLAAVISNNFTNYLFTLAEEYCLKEAVPFKAVVPLLEETVKRLHHASPADVQTGPAARNDTATIEKHLQMLEGYKELQEIYAELSRRIASKSER